MALAALVEGRPTVAKSTGQRGTCIGIDCRAPMVAKVGTVIRPHWAHIANEACGLDDAGEKGWHLTWRTIFVNLGAETEVTHGRHRADIVLADGRTLEFQTTYLSPSTIASRETTHGNMAWIYRMTDEVVDDALMVPAPDLNGQATFTWLAPRRSMLSHRRPVYWHMLDEVWSVWSIASSVDRTATGGDVWTIRAQRVAPDWCEFADLIVAGLDFVDPPIFYGLDRQVSQAVAAGVGLTSTPTAYLPDNIDETCHRTQAGMARAPELERDPAYHAAIAQYAQMTKCAVCLMPMVVGQRNRHITCSPLLDCCDTRQDAVDLARHAANHAKAEAEYDERSKQVPGWDPGPRDACNCAKCHRVST